MNPGLATLRLSFILAIVCVATGVVRADDYRVWDFVVVIPDAELQVDSKPVAHPV